MSAKPHELKIKQAITLGLESLSLNGDENALLEQLTRYVLLLEKWSKVHNLTAIREPLLMVEGHIIDSLTVLPYLRGNRIIDVGTGAGLPGIPLALAAADKYFVLLDSQLKKYRFLKHALLELKLENVELAHCRVEAHQASPCYSSVVSRAFADIPKMLSQTNHLACKDGLFIGMKGQYPESELEMLGKPYKMLEVHRASGAQEGAERHIVCIEFNQ